MPAKKSPTRHSSIAPAKTSPMTAAAKAAVSEIKPSEIKPSEIKSVVAATPVVAPAVKAAEVKAPEVKAVETKAVEAKVESKPAAALPAFPSDQVANLRDGSVEVAVEACEKLAKTGDARAIAPLISVLENADGYCHVVTRSAAAMALGQFNDEKAIGALTYAAKDDMVEVSREAILALGDLKAVAAAGELMDIAGNASGFYLNVARLAAVRSLGRMKAKAAKPMLEGIVSNSWEDASIVAAANEAIGQL